MDTIKYHVISPVSLYRLFDVVGIPLRVAAPIIRDFNGWLKNNGPEWTVSRIKNLKTLYLQHYAGNKTFRLEKENGISCHSDGTPKGHFKALWTMGSSRRAVAKILTALMSYTAIRVEGHPTESQWEKFHTAVTNPRDHGVLPSHNISDFYRELYQKCWRESKYDTLLEWTTSDVKKVLHFDYKKGIVRCPDSSLSADKHIADFMILCFPLLMSERSTLQLFSDVLTDSVRYSPESFLLAAWQQVADDAADSLAHYDCMPVVGSIGFIQERGAKLRAVANPLRSIQVVLSKLNNTLARAAQSLPWDCTFDQGSGERWARRKLQQGIKLFAFDISNATDTAPLEDQIAFLESIGPDSNEFRATLTFFRQVARGSWAVNTPAYPGYYLSWTKGQGLGITCSFNVFAQTHGARLHQLSVNKGMLDSFVVLGDDVIVEEGLAEDYQNFLVNTWGCDVSKPKTISSDSLTEFASRLITAGRNIPAYKYPKSNRLFSSRAPLELLVKYGKRGLKLVPTRFRGEVQVMSSMPSPEGLGWKWNEADVLIEDPYPYVELISVKKRDVIPDVAHVTVLKRPGSRYDSFVVRGRKLADREQDLIVAFGNFQSPSAILGMSNLVTNERHDSFVFKKENETNSLRVTPVMLELLILHANANLERPECESLHNDVLKYTHTHSGVSRPLSPFQEDQHNSQNQLRSFFKKVKRLIGLTTGFSSLLQSLFSKDTSEKNDSSI